MSVRARRVWKPCVVVGLPLALTVVVGCGGEIVGPGGEAGPMGAMKPAGSMGATPGAGGSGGTKDSVLPGSPPPGSTGGGAPPTDCRSPGALAPARLLLLSSSQHTNAVKDLLGVSLAGLAPAVSDLTTVSGAAALQFDQMAGRAASEATGAARLKSLHPCMANSEAESCAEEFIRSWASRAFRRPLGTEEVQDLMAVFRAGRVDGFATGIQRVIEGVLQAGSFLYRSELGGKAQAGGLVTLTPHELAGALAFALLQSVPDQTLWARAQDGTLTKLEVLSAEVARLLANPRAQENLTAAATHWFGADEVLGATKDSKLFPEFSPALKASLRESARRLVDDALWQSRMSDLFTTSRLHVDYVMAKAYKITKPAGAGFGPVEMPATERGGGILVHPAPLAAFADDLESSVVHRGLHVFESVLCGTATPPPPELQDAIAMAPKGASQRMLADWRAQQAVCGACHALFDPLGLTLEHYDAIGRYRPKDAAGKAISAAATVAATGDLDGPVNNAVELAAKLAKSPKVMGCLVNQAASHAFARVIDGQQSCRLSAAHERAAATGNFVDVMTAILTSPAFAVRSLEASP